MAKKDLYGSRWKIVEPSRLGHGGQGDVFRVIDTRGEHEGQHALKRVRSPNRRTRFENEIAAITRLAHPNIISLVDYPALTESGATADDSENQYYVMPIAEGGDLSDSERLTLYAEDINAVLKVALQIASALEVAHKSKIIHRDVKPKNILFKGKGHDAVLSDFGICLLRDEPRATDVSEMVGPRFFIAPELENFGQLEVTPAVDVYSLGKVIYYMISGGEIIPREALHEEQYRKRFEKGQRYRLLQSLLAKMICRVEDRIKDMATVVLELKKLQEWEQRAQLLPISSSGLEGLEHFKADAHERMRVAQQNLEAREHEKSVLEAALAGLKTTIEGELVKIADVISSPPAVTCTVTAAESSLRVRLISSRLITELSEHEADRGEAEEDEGAEVEIFPVLGQAAASVEPSDGAFDNPSLGQGDKALGGVGAFDDFRFEVR